MGERSDMSEMALDGVLRRLAREAAPGDALTARVLADAAMVTAESAAKAPAAAPSRPRESGGWFDRIVRGGLFGPAGAVAAMGLCLAIGIGVGVTNDREVLQRIDESMLMQISEIDVIESEVIAAADDDIFGLDAPL